jgi:hypothetical protein
MSANHKTAHTFSFWRYDSIDELIKNKRSEALHTTVAASKPSNSQTSTVAAAPHSRTSFDHFSFM